jgi:hypothetical protein
MNAKMSPLGEKNVGGLAVAVLVAGFASAVFEKPTSISPPGFPPVPNVSASHAQYEEPAKDHRGQKALIDLWVGRERKTNCALSHIETRR